MPSALGPCRRFGGAVGDRWRGLCCGWLSSRLFGGRGAAPPDGFRARPAGGLVSARLLGGLPLRHR
eukprot:4567709-Lingulodinium_polyedra.AAC.1